MKKLCQKAKSLLTIIITAAIVLTSVGSVHAASDTIQLGQATKTKSYIAGVSFSYKITTDGKYLYCLNMNKNTASNVQANLVKNSKYIDGGLVYILKNGYPNKDITKDKDKDYYITQTAVWWYLDKTTGSQNLGDQFKNSGSDAYGMRHYVKELVEAGYQHRNDSYGISNTKIQLISSDTSMTLSNNFYVTKDIKVNGTNISTINISIDNAPEGTLVEKAGGSTTYSGAFVVKANETFRIKVPATAIKGTSVSIKLNAAAQGYTQYSAYEYKPVDSNMQNVALLEKSSKKVSTSLNYTADSSRVTVVKVDTNTKEAIAGAHLVLKDSAGNVITSWDSTINGHVIRNLANGTYTIEETSAPTGYLLNKNITKFTISDTKRDIKILIENAPKKVVVNISKVDQATNAPLAGAVLVVRDSTGTQIARFTTTENTYVLTDLKNGTYTVEEETAPAGYMKSTDKITFTVDDAHLSHQITFVNAKEVIVPDTASVSSIIMLILGIVITGAGIRFIYKNGQRA